MQINNKINLEFNISHCIYIVLESQDNLYLLMSKY
jgi:hypothetical protein